MNRKTREEPHPILASVLEYMYIIIGAAIIAVGFNVFLLPNEVASGSVVGISTILKDCLTGILGMCNTHLIFLYLLQA
jgi:uncharacterized membrane-anchored protein YitT (DUF2179 family)